MQITQTILQQLIHNEDYCRKVFPFLKETYFESPADKHLFKIIKNHLDKYNKRPTQDIIKIELESASLSQTHYEECKQLINSLGENPQELDWLINTSENWCRERAIYNGLLSSLDILNDKSGKKEKGQIVGILEDAISVSFDQHIGHDYFEDSEERFNFYHAEEVRIPFDIEKFNTITGGGLPNKSIMIIMGGVGIGKTATMCSMAAANMMIGKNPLYITMEMAEERIAERIDANLLDTSIADLRLLTKEMYEQKVARVRSKTPGKLIIKEYPTGSASVLNFRHLLHELRFKKKFKPDILYLDYLNICSSSRLKLSSHVGVYSFVQAITQEVRGLAVEYNIPLITATQLNREGFQSSDPGMEHVAESFGTAATGDLIVVLIVNDELAALNQVMVKQIKNRFDDFRQNKVFVIGRDLSKMRLYNVEKDTTASNPKTNIRNNPLHKIGSEERKELFKGFA